MKSALALFLTTVAATLAACGGDASRVSDLEGTYVLDVERTSPPGAQPRAEADEARLAATFRADSYRLEILPGGAFRTTLLTTEEPFVLSGTWAQEAGSIRMTTTAVNGEPAPQDVELEETGTIEGGTIVLTQGGVTTYLKKL